MIEQKIDFHGMFHTNKKVTLKGLFFSHNKSNETEVI